MFPPRLDSLAFLLTAGCSFNKPSLFPADQLPLAKRSSGSSHEQNWRTADSQYSFTINRFCLNIWLLVAVPSWCSLQSKVFHSFPTVVHSCPNGFPWFFPCSWLFPMEKESPGLLLVLGHLRALTMHCNWSGRSWWRFIPYV